MGGSGALEHLNLFPLEESSEKKGNDEYLREKKEEKVLVAASSVTRAASACRHSAHLFLVVVLKSMRLKVKLVSLENKWNLNETFSSGGKCVSVWSLLVALDVFLLSADCACTDKNCAVRSRMIQVTGCYDDV